MAKNARLSKLMGFNIPHFKTLFKISLCLPSFCLPLLTYAGQISGLRDSRYCEILLGENKFNIAVYNTIGLNDCPEEIWKKISVDSVKRETGVSFAKLNGPRYWMIDGMTNSKLVNPEQKTICGLDMRKAGILKLDLMDILTSAKPYKEHQVDRQTTWVYKAGKPIYELINPQGQVFVMQSYSIEKKPQSATTLEKLGSELSLPKGWRFRAGILKKDTDLNAINNKATVVQDNYLNTYQLATHDFLSE
ncbi:hypothetical protein [Legionella cardiaca]|uniref:Uncharacterized protein n=1 Tax=Legionella cardiaca TaxID=1071983 RepID=A0ABY8AU87_9GAMM|nr:hypothetical protein [Legionella cardiaca]WED44238.1 hypothetical protein PXX05_05490 [Legionella cardiaca]